jgi:integrase
MDLVEVSPAAAVVVPQAPPVAKHPAKRKPITESSIKGLKPAPAGQRVKHKTRTQGLYLLVDDADGRWWRFRIQIDGAEKHYALGTVAEGVTLAVAESRAAELRVARQNGASALDLATLASNLSGRARPHPAAVAAAMASRAGATLQDVHDAWRKRVNGGLAATTRECDERAIGYVLFELGPRESMGAVELGQINTAVQRIEAKHGRTTAKRGLRLAKAMWRWARINYSEQVKHNPAAELEPREVLSKAKKTKHRPAIVKPEPFGALLRGIDDYKGQPVVQLGLQVLALTFVRPGELRLGEWPEFDLDSDAPQWVIPAERMKMRKEHVVPLATQTVALLRELKRHARGNLVLPSLRPGKPISDNTFNVALRNIREKAHANGVMLDEHVAHGFRASARSLLTEECNQPAPLVDLQLAHVTKEATAGLNATYDRAEFKRVRRDMMQVWADYCARLRVNGVNV